MSDTNLNNASFTPEIQDSEESTNKQTYSATGSFRFWCQKVLPLVYDDSLSYYELLCKVVNYLNNVIQNVDNLNTSVTNTNTAFDNLQDYVNTTKDTLVEVYNELEQYVNDYFNNLDIQEEINAKLDGMASDGSLSGIISPFIPSAVSDWLSKNITPTSPAIDASLSVSGAGADAKVTGDFIRANSAELTDIRVDIKGLYTSFPITPTTETNRYIGETLNIRSWGQGSIAYFPIAEDKYKNKKFTIKSTSPINYMAIGFSTVFPSYGTILTNGYYKKASISELSAWSRDDSQFVVIAYETADESKISLSVDFSDSELNLEKINAVQNQIGQTNNTFDSIVTSEVNLLEDATMYASYLYPHYNTAKEANSATNCFAPIPVKAGLTYYFRRIWGNFSFIKLSDGGYASFDASTEVVSGSYTPSKDGEAYITVESVRDASSALFTTSKSMYDKELFATRFIPNKLEVPKTYYVEKDGSGDFTKLTEAIEEATKYMDSTVYVGPGTWDLIDELGSDYIESVGINKRGLYLKNRVHLIFASNSKVTCNYAGTTASVRTWLSAFNTGEYGFTLENCRLEASNCRYAVHDERDSDTDQYTNVYKNCSMYMDNSANTETTAHQCIGGGLGLNGHIVIENCDFESINTRAVPSSAYTPVSYHNSAGTGKSRIDISGVYMVSGTVRLNKYGTSTEDTECYVHDCSFTYPIINEHEAGSTAENMNVTSWNNEIRT